MHQAAQHAQSVACKSNVLARCAQLTREVHAEAANTEEGERGEEGRTFTTRSFVCEQQQLRVPATSAPAAKLKNFHEQMVELSKCLCATPAPAIPDR